MFGEFLNIVFKSLKLDKSLYRDPKNFGEASIYFAGIIMILDGIAGAVAANTIIKTAIAMSGLTAILTWFIWSILIYVLGVKIFPDKPITKKPLEVRMGKGKGAVEYWAAVVKPGRILFEVGGVPLDIAKEALRLAAQKLPVKTKFIIARDYEA